MVVRSFSHIDFLRLLRNQAQDFRTDEGIINDHISLLDQRCRFHRQKPRIPGTCPGNPDFSAYFLFHLLKSPFQTSGKSLRQYLTFVLFPGNHARLELPGFFVIVKPPDPDFISGSFGVGCHR